MTDRPACAQGRAVPGALRGRSAVWWLTRSDSGIGGANYPLPGSYLVRVTLIDKDSYRVAAALVGRARTLPRELYRSLTWQRGTNESTNGLLRPTLSKELDLRDYLYESLDVIARQLNECLRKTLAFRTPAEMLIACVASNG